MAVSELHSAIGKLGNDCALNNWAVTTDHEGPLPDLPTDADRQKLTQLLENQQPTLEEQRVFEAGYREAMERLREDQDPDKNPIALKELGQVLSKYWFVLPPEGTTQRAEADELITKAITTLRDRVGQLTSGERKPRAKVGPTATR